MCDLGMGWGEGEFVQPDQIKLHKIISFYFPMLGFFSGKNPK